MTALTPDILYEAAQSQNLVISGPLIEIGTLNKNGWGIGLDEVEHYMAGVIGVPLRKCSGAGELIAEHSCDYNWNPKDDIGRIIAASVIDGWIHAAAEVTDSIAQRKISEGTWDQLWSAFLSYTSQDKENLLSGTTPKSVTLVKNPAYVGSGFSVFSVNNNTPIFMEASMTADKTYKQDEVDKVVAAAIEKAKKDTISTKEAEKQVAAAIEKEAEKSKDMLSKDDADKLVAAAVKEAAAKAKKIEGGDETITKEQATDMVSAAVAKAAETSVPREEVEKMVSASAKSATSATLEMIAKEKLVKEVLVLQVSAGLIEKDKTEEAVEALKLKSAATLEADMELLTKVTTVLAAAGTEAVDKFKKANIPTGGSGGPKTSGVFIPGKGFEE